MNKKRFILGASILLAILIMVFLQKDTKVLKQAELSPEIKSELVKSERELFQDQDSSEIKKSSELNSEAPFNAQEEVTKQTEKEFLDMKLPLELSKDPKERYQEVYGVFLTSSFFLSEIAAGHLDPSKETLLKALKGLSLYYFEMESLSDQGDDSLSIISNEHTAIFEETLKELTPKEEELIRSILKLQQETEND